ncbi:MAG: hypothetical protein AAFW75_06300 [Cyanobacteria bacterium J06636_16]
MRQKRKSFVFVIPVRNPKDDKVTDYQCIETALHETVRSLTSQTWQNTHVVIACHRIPDWSTHFGDKITFLNVDHIPVFPPNTNPVRVDKGLKYILGILYAHHVLNPALIMPMDADDYINVTLAKNLTWRSRFDRGIDGYLVKKGLHVNLRITPEYAIKYEAAYQIKGFDQSCGSCRIFKADKLVQRLKSIAPDIIERLGQWPTKSADESVTVPVEPVIWLSDSSKSAYLTEDSMVNILGRHIRQKEYFKFSKLSAIGAAKGCGHGNHDGPRQGEIHQDKLIGEFPLAKFHQAFGLASKK